MLRLWKSIHPFVVSVFLGALAGAAPNLLVSMLLALASLPWALFDAFVVPPAIYLGEWNKAVRDQLQQMASLRLLA
jgi:hypothetical protein